MSFIGVVPSYKPQTLHAASPALRAALAGFFVEELEAALCGPFGLGILTMRQLACIDDAGLEDACNTLDACGYGPGRCAALHGCRHDARFLIRCGFFVMMQ